MSGTESMSYEEMAYELPEIWQEEWFPKEDHERVRRISELIPRDATTLADIGCGNGLFLNFLQAGHGAKFERLVGVDRSQAALAHVKTEKRLAPVYCLPFRDGEFDAVTCMEVLEHLPVATFPRAIKELSRVARKYLVVTVPYRQDLQASLSTCPQCCARFNADFHVRSFDEAKLSGLFQDHGFRQTAVLRLGESVVYSDQILRQRLREFLRPNAPTGLPSYAVCPVCGFHDPEKLQQDLARRKEVAKLAGSNPGQVPRQPVSMMRRLLAAVLPAQRRYRWICARYERCLSGGSAGTSKHDRHC